MEEAQAQPELYGRHSPRLRRAAGPQLRAGPLIVRGDWSWRSGPPDDADESARQLARRAGPADRRTQLADAVDWAAERAAACAAWPVADRIDAMTGWASGSSHHKEEIASLETREMGKPIRQTRKIVDMVVTRIGLLCEARKSLAGEFYASEGNRATQRAHGFSVRDPFGVTAGILPFNSPVSAMVWKIAPGAADGKCGGDQAFRARAGCRTVGRATALGHPNAGGGVAGRPRRRRRARPGPLAAPDDREDQLYREHRRRRRRLPPRRVQTSSG
jgi:hypothetical protein